MELVILTLTGCDQAPLRGQQPEKPPALPEDRYKRFQIRNTTTIARRYERGPWKMVSQGEGIQITADLW